MTNKQKANKKMHGNWLKEADFVGGSPSFILTGVFRQKLQNILAVLIPEGLTHTAFSSVGSDSSQVDRQYVGHVVMVTLWSPGWQTCSFCFSRRLWTRSNIKLKPSSTYSSQCKKQSESYIAHTLRAKCPPVALIHKGLKPYVLSECRFYL